MAINEMTPLSLTEAKKIVETTKEDGNEEIKSFLKKFAKLNNKEAEEIREKLKSLGILKMKEEHIVKIMDFLPEDASDINKIFVDVGLDENEINKLLEVVGKYK